MNEETDPRDDIEAPEDAAAETPRAPAGEELLRAKVAELEDRVKRLQADFVNETRRISRQAENDRTYAIQKVVVDLLPIVDAIHQASDALGTGEGSRQAREGFELVGRQLDDVLQRHGVQRIEAVGKPFDPTRHEAFLMVEQAELAPGTVAQVVRPGFTLHGRVVRPAHVAVTKPPASPNPSEPGR
jgi:molecular chaperone GrpE